MSSKKNESKKNESKKNDIISAWKNAGLEPPKITLAENAKSKERYLVIEDDQTIYRLMNKEGQIYVVAAFRCKLLKDIYSCGEPIHPITCSKIEAERDKIGLTMLDLMNL